MPYQIKFYYNTVLFSHCLYIPQIELILILAGKFTSMRKKEPPPDIHFQNFTVCCSPAPHGGGAIHLVVVGSAVPVNFIATGVVSVEPPAATVGRCLAQWARRGGRGRPRMPPSTQRPPP